MTARVRTYVVAVVLTLAALWPATARAQVIPPGCEVGTLPLPSGGLSLICKPEPWNGQLVVFAHAYVPSGAPLGFYNLTVGDVNLPALVQSFGFAFATTSYRANGLVILEGMEDIRELVTRFTTLHGSPSRTFVTGASEGGLVATLLIERHPDEFDAGLAACGPIGSFRGQVNYVGDFRVLFDYFFPHVIPGTAINVPPGVLINWTTVYLPAIRDALLANPGRAFELMATAKAAYDPANFATVIQTTANVLSYNVFGGPDAEDTLGGNPFGNLFRLYFGSSNDLRLNLRVQRFAASPVALAAMTQYETNGHLTRRLVTLHTTADELIPFSHETLYLAKVLLSGHSGLIPLPVARYGHCNFTATEILTAFGLTVQ
jgi:pimeloyl-ACP methyl ester carboxylesterase